MKITKEDKTLEAAREAQSKQNKPKMAENKYLEEEKLIIIVNNFFEKEKKKDKTVEEDSLIKKGSGKSNGTLLNSPKMRNPTMLATIKTSLRKRKN